MATTLAAPAREHSFLLEPLCFAGWQLQVQDGVTPRIRATHADVELDVSAASFAEAAGTVFAQAMCSTRRRGQGA